MASRVEYKSSVAKDLRKLDKEEARRVLKELEDTLRADPECGVPLKGRFKGLLKLRIGDFRVIYVRTEDGALVLRIGHRRSIYR